MKKQYLVSDADRLLLQRVVSQVRQMPVNPSRYNGNEEGDTYTPEVHIVLTPPSGIPAMTRVGTGDYPDEGTYGTSTGTSPDAIDCEFFPGSAICRVFRIAEWNDPPCLVDTNILKLIYNLSMEAVDGDSWEEAKKDKFGQWVITKGGDATDNDLPDYSGLLNLQPSDCLKARCLDNGSSVILHYSGALTWTSTAFLSYPTGRYGRVEAVYSGGEIHCFLGVQFTSGTHLGTGTSPETYKELLNLHSGIYVGNAMTEHVEPNGLACNGNKFRVELSCIPCSFVETSLRCCPDYPSVPNPLYGTVTVGGVFTGTFVIPLVASDGILHTAAWRGNMYGQLVDNCSEFGFVGPFDVEIFCTEDGWVGSVLVYVGFGSSNYPLVLGSATCGPPIVLKFAPFSFPSAFNPPHFGEPCIPDLPTSFTLCVSDSPFGCPSSSGTGGGGCFDGACGAGVADPLTATVSGATGMYATFPFPSPFDLNCTTGGDMHFWQAAPFVYGGVTIMPQIIPSGVVPEFTSFGGPDTLADAGYVCGEHPAMVFHVNDGAGNSMVVTVTG